MVAFQAVRQTPHRCWLRVGLSACAAASLCSLTSARASAADPPQKWAPGTLLAEATFGLGGSPVGILGATVDYGAARWLSGYLGSGIGGSGGVQFATGLRLRVSLSPTMMIGIGPGLSAGRYKAIGFFDEAQPKEWKSAGWMNLEAFLDVRTFPRVTIRPFVGYSRMLDPASAQRINKDTGEPVAGKVESGSVNLPYFGIAIGYVFLP